MTADVTIITPTLASRADLLAELADDVAAQTHVPRAWLWEVDEAMVGPAVMRNALAARASTVWLAFVDDDDRIDRHHLETLLTHADGMDVVYSDWRTEGREGFGPDPCTDYAQLADRNWIPVTALVRARAFAEVGGFPLTCRDEDRGMWLRIWQNGGQFRHVPLVTWTYRFGSWGHRTFGGAR